MTSDKVKSWIGIIASAAVSVAAAMGYKLDGGLVTSVVCLVIIVATTAYSAWRTNPTTTGQAVGRQLGKLINMGLTSTQAVAVLEATASEDVALVLAQAPTSAASAAADATTSE